MNKRCHVTGFLTLACMILSALPACAAETVTADELGPAPTWREPTADDVRSQVHAWLDEASLESSQRLAIADLWPPEEAAVNNEVLAERLVATFAIVEPKVQPLIKTCNEPFSGVVPPKLDWLVDASAPALLGNNLRLFYASWLARTGFHDECLQTLDGLTTDDVADPAALLFYSAVAHHRLVQSEPCNDALSQLLERADELPERYQQLAKLMQLDIHDLEVDSLDHIARRMADIENRLKSGRADKPVRDVEDGVIESLDKLIKKAEQQQQQQQAAASSQGNRGSQKPMPDSQIAGGKGPGNVAKKFIGDKSGWGNLPPKDRDEALQQIGREFPSHYRDVIEQYFKRLATEDDSASEPN